MRLVKALDRGCQLIRLLVDEDAQLSVADIATRLDIPLSTAYELVHTLDHHDFVDLVQEPDGDRRVKLGLRLFQAGAAYRNRISYIKEAQQIADEAAEQFGEATHIAVLDGSDALYIAKAESSKPQTVRIYSFVGGREGAHVSALGKCLLSNLSRDELEQRVGPDPLKAFTDRTITSLDELWHHLQEVRERSYAVDDEESTQGLRCVGVPIRLPDGSVVSALSTSIPVHRLTIDAIPRVAKVLREKADGLEERLKVSRMSRWPH
jgi:DNA-binding IclR family transcriptional regulator